jgi:hypothetical protein
MFFNSSKDVAKTNGTTADSLETVYSATRESFFAANFSGDCGVKLVQHTKHECEGSPMRESSKRGMVFRSLESRAKGHSGNPSTLVIRATSIPYW